MCGRPTGPRWIDLLVLNFYCLSVIYRVLHATKWIKSTAAGDSQLMSCTSLYLDKTMNLREFQCNPFTTTVYHGSYKVCTAFSPPNFCSTLFFFCSWLELVESIYLHIQMTMSSYFWSVFTVWSAGFQWKVRTQSKDYLSIIGHLFKS